MRAEHHDMPAQRVRIRLTADEIEWLLRAHRERAVDILTWSPISAGARRLADEAMNHHEARISLFKAVAEGRRRVIAEG